MIFPDLPRRHYPVLTQPVPVLVQEIADVAEITPKTAEEWFAEHFPDSQAVLHAPTQVSFQDDPWGYFKFFSILVFMVIWSWYWHQFQ